MSTDTETLAEVRFTDTEHDAIITALLNPDDDCAHNLAPLFRAVRSILAARIVQARAGEGALRERIEALAADLQQDIEDRREDTPDDDGSWPITRAEWVGHIAGLGDALTQLRAALTTADPS